MDGKPYGANSYISHKEAIDDPYTTRYAGKYKIDDLGLCKGQKFLFHFDFGDDWQFIINTQRIEETDEKVSYVVKRKGTLEQYPDYDDEW